MFVFRLKIHGVLLSSLDKNPHQVDADLSQSPSTCVLYVHVESSAKVESFVNELPALQSPGD